MGVSSSHGTARPRRTRRTIWFTFAAMVAGPVACLVVLWGLILGGVLGGAMGRVSVIVPLYNMNTLVTVGIGLVFLGELKDVNVWRLLAGAALIVAGGVLAGTSVK